MGESADRAQKENAERAKRDAERDARDKAALTHFEKLSELYRNGRNEQPAAGTSRPQRVARAAPRVEEAPARSREELHAIEQDDDEQQAYVSTISNSIKFGTSE